MRAVPASLFMIFAATAAMSASPPRPPIAEEKVLAGFTAGEPVQCISLPLVRSSDVSNGRIFYRYAQRMIYVNEPDASCGLRSDAILISRTPSTRLCSGETVEMRDRASRAMVGSCVLGAFTPWRKAK